MSLAQNRFSKGKYKYTPSSSYSGIPKQHNGDDNYKDLIDKSTNLIANKNYSRAIITLNVAIINNPKAYEAYMYRGVAYLGLESFQMAISDFNTVESLESDLVYLYALRGRAKSEVKDYQGAIDDYTTVIRYVPDSDDTYFYIGDLYKKQNNASKACEWWLSGSKLGNKDCDKQYKSFCGSNNQSTQSTSTNTYLEKAYENTSTISQRNASLKLATVKEM